MAALGDDGRGYELARKLEACGVWRPWLGDSLYSNFIHSLSSSSAWDSFMTVGDSKSRDQIHLQLRVRALLFDKASVSLFLRVSNSPSVVSKLNPNYLQLHGDDVYFTLEDGVPRDKRFRQEDFPENWYNKFIENYRASKPHVLSFSNREPDRRNPSEMSTYLRLLERHKRRRIEFKGGESGGFSNSNTENKMQSSTVLDSDNLSDDDSCFFPETMFTLNCVPDSAIVPRIMVEEKQRVEVFGVLDTLPQMPTKNSIMLERLGIRPEYLGQGPGHSRTKVGSDGNRNQLSLELAMQMSKMVVARVLSTVGYEGGSEMSIDVLSKFLSCHVSKLGRILKVLADSYRKQCSAMELLKMFLQVAGKSCNLAALAEHMKDSRGAVQQSALQIQNMQSQLPLPQQSTLQLSQQIPRPMHAQMAQMIHPQNLTLQQQQQLERMRQRAAAAAAAAAAASSPRPVMNMDKDRPMIQVKLENPPDLPVDSNTFNAINSRQAQMQRRQQQIAALQRIMGPSVSQMRQPAGVHMPPVQSQNVSAVRAPPVKVEGFQELMGGDTSLKQSSDESRLTSPSK
ncbi:hypothetical protein Cgig2_007379 [Carnegiea gigantea]|uniref:Bromodomain associated domain-containing protein n=1 Tax=Carnegiea gigantea TaxID=171969 RepID=A0A9Q1KZZ6_9CARY|nr:hypothetical protein Cgig2_007379 [Carnegiea gigantea]